MSTSVIPSRPRWSRTSIPFVWLSPGEKRWDPINYFFYGVFDHGWYEFQLKYWQLCFGFCKIQAQDPASRDIWWHQHGHTSCCNQWKIREEKVKDNKMVKINKFLWKNERNYCRSMNLAQKEGSYWEEKMGLWTLV